MNGGRLVRCGRRLRCGRIMRRSELAMRSFRWMRLAHVVRSAHAMRSAHVKRSSHEMRGRRIRCLACDAAGACVAAAASDVVVACDAAGACDPAVARDAIIESGQLLRLLGRLRRRGRVIRCGCSCRSARPNGPRLRLGALAHDTLDRPPKEQQRRVGLEGVRDLGFHIVALHCAMIVPERVAPNPMEHLPGCGAGYPGALSFGPLFDGVIFRAAVPRAHVFVRPFPPRSTGQNMIFNQMCGVSGLQCHAGSASWPFVTGRPNSYTCPGQTPHLLGQIRLSVFSLGEGPSCERRTAYVSVGLGGARAPALRARP